MILLDFKPYRTLIALKILSFLGFGILFSQVEEIGDSSFTISQNSELISIPYYSNEYQITHNEQVSRIVLIVHGQNRNANDYYSYLFNISTNLNLNEKLTLKDIEDSFINYFQYPEVPFPDLLLRTAGENRISNFLLYQLSYTELIFIEDLWPDINADILNDVLLEFNSRNRTYGKN